ncbi:hypothetical protein DN730_02100 [Marinomonas piezotolerans]|uniref:Uncharacterized protein n=1 Tax=Marinomonas piezotolerans TaxID=2213058 RepID=A0A370UDK6_9GAMM|nr:hypothetical protein [Marinomonas piezotolerans]RDL45864.1 hypothetical protein DN730_02100 [Marinomonas piezotolerans]
MRKDDDVEIPSLTLDQDEISDRSSLSAQANQAKKRRLNPPPAKPAQASTANTKHTKKPSLAGIYLLLLLILCGSAGGGYWLWMQNQALRDELLGAQSQIQDLDHQLLAADVSTDQLGSTVEETLKNHESEIRKLWGVSYDRNRGNISSNSDAIEQLDDKLSQLRETVSTQAKLVAVQGDAFNEIEDGYNRLIETVANVQNSQESQKSSLTTISEKLDRSAAEQASQQGRIEALRLQLDQTVTSLEQIAQRLEQQKIELANIQAKPSDSAPSAEVNAKLNEYDEAIRSIDEFRPQVLREINSLKAQVRQISLQQTLSLDE